MRRPAPARLASLVSLLFVAACTGGGLAPLPTASVVASFPPHAVADAITIAATDPLPLRRAELVLPNGTAIPSDPIDVTASPRVAGSQALPAAMPGDDPGELALPGPVAISPSRSQGRLLIVVSRTSIALPDPVAYRRDWRNCRIRLRFGSPPGEVETRDIAAPAPPEPSPSAVPPPVRTG